MEAAAADAALHPENSTTAGIVELDRYIQEPMLARKENPLIWWHQRKNVYPHLFQHMLKRQNLLATSVPNKIFLAFRLTVLSL